MRFLSRIPLRLLAVAWGVLGSGLPASADELRSDRPNTLAFEAGGRGILYAFEYERAFSDTLGAGIGIGGLDARCSECADYRLRYVAVPVYLTVNVPAATRSSLYLSPGVTMLSSDGLHAILGAAVGYRLQTTPGFVLRATVTLFWEPRLGATQSVVDKPEPWLGLQLGWAF